MAHQVTILKAGASLPDGRVYYTVGQQVVLSDAQFAQITQATFDGGWVQDDGEVAGTGVAIADVDGLQAILDDYGARIAALESGA